MFEKENHMDLVQFLVTKYTIRECGSVLNGESPDFSKLNCTYLLRNSTPQSYILVYNFK